MNEITELLTGAERGAVLLVLLMLIAIEYFYSKLRHKEIYQPRETAASIAIAIVQPFTRVASGLVLAPVILWTYHYRLFTMPLDDVRNIIALFLLAELTYYWFHRWSHTVRLLWAAHSVHHSQNSFNLSAAIRLPWLGGIFALVLSVLPLVWIGFSPTAVLGVFTINLLYQFILHTRLIKSFGPFEHILNTPAHHLVHHASNASCLDKNYGGMLIIYDHIFGTYAEAPKDEPVIFGLTDPIHSHNPFVIQFREWGRMINDVFSARSLRDAYRALFGRPGEASI
jgi:sterol desaturase/sphingolipid hydroxylase (fatty acid hydroxylase superfamily)